MEIKIKTWLEDIRLSIEQIDDFLPKERNFIVFQNDLKTKKAIERNLEIIGEATNRILLKNPEIKITNARRIVDTRNRIIHGYDKVSDEVIWAIISKDLKQLEKEVIALLKQ